MIQLCSRNFMISCGTVISIHLSVSKNEDFIKSALHSEFEITHLLVTTTTRFYHPFICHRRDPWIEHFNHTSTRTRQHSRTCLHLDPVKFRDIWERMGTTNQKWNHECHSQKFVFCEDRGLAAYWSLVFLMIHCQYLLMEVLSVLMKALSNLLWLLCFFFAVRLV